MKRYIRNTAVLITPFLLMIAVKEIVRPSITEKPYSFSQLTAINSVDATADKCTWLCHNNTGFCKENHVELLKPYFTLILSILE